MIVRMKTFSICFDLKSFEKGYNRIIIKLFINNLIFVTRWCKVKDKAVFIV